MAFGKKGKGGEVVKIVPLNILRTTVRIAGDLLVVHNWDEKAKEMMRCKQMGKTPPQREAKDPQACFEASKYLDADGHDCIQARAVKSAMVDAASFMPELTKVSIRGALFVKGDLLPIRFKKCVLREDMVRVGMGAADIRYRASYIDWSCEVPLEINSSVIGLEQAVNILSHAGFAIGLCEGRPQKNGDWGRFAVDLSVAKREPKVA